MSRLCNSRLPPLIMESCELKIEKYKFHVYSVHDKCLERKTFVKTLAFGKYSEKNSEYIVLKVREAATGGRNYHYLRSPSRKVGFLSRCFAHSASSSSKFHFFDQQLCNTTGRKARASDSFAAVRNWMCRNSYLALSKNQVFTTWNVVKHRKGWHFT